MRDRRAYKTLMLLFIVAIVAAVSTGGAHAFWGEQKKESKLDKDAYETLVKKNLDLRNEVDRLVKEQEQLRGIYKILLEKVKTLQRDNAELSEQLKSGNKNGATAKGAVAEPYTEPGADMGDDRAKGMQEGIFANKEIVEKQAETIRAQNERIDSLEAELKALNNVFDMGALKKNYPDAFAGRKDAEGFMASRPVKRIREEVDKLTAKQDKRRTELSSLDKEIESSGASQKELKMKLGSAAKQIAQIKEEIVNTNAEIKDEGEQAMARQDKIKALESSLDKAVSEQRDSEAALQDTSKRTAQIKVSIVKAGAVAPPKGSPADFKSEEVKSLEKELEKAAGDESQARRQVEDAASKVDDLRQGIEENRAGSEGSVAKAESAKEKIRALEKDLAAGEKEESSLKKDIQRLTKKTGDLKDKRNLLIVAIAREDEKIRGLKKIVESQMLDIANAGGGGAEAGLLAGRAGSMLSILNERIKELKAKNEELESGIKSLERSDNRPLRKNELPPDVKKKMDKERLDMHYNLAVVYDNNKMYKDAEREYLKCLEINPNDPDVIYNLGILYDDKLNNNHKAYNYYKKYLEIRPMGEGSTKVRVWLTNIELEDRVGREVR